MGGWVELYPSLFWIFEMFLTLQSPLVIHVIYHVSRLVLYYLNCHYIVIYIYIGECVCVCVCLCVYPSKHIDVAVCGPIGTQFRTHMQIHLEKVVGKIKICPV